MIKLAVIGDPIGHTLSPLIQGKMMERLGVEGEYTARHVRPEELEDFVASALQEGLTGFNITIPHKSGILPFLAGTDPYAESCGAVNTVKITSGKLWGYNTDGDGIRSALREMGADFPGARVALLGAGGAALSICRKALLSGAEAVEVFCRSPEKAVKMAGEGVEILPFSQLGKPGLGERFNLIINATPLGMSGMDRDFEQFAFLEGFSGAVCDIVYKPAETTLLKECAKRKIPCCNGLNMLIYQAVYAFQIFTGMSFDAKDMANYLGGEVSKALKAN